MRKAIKPYATPTLPMHWFIAFLIALTGMDLLGINVAGMSLRLSQFVFIGIFLMGMRKFKLPIKYYLGLLVLTLSFIPSLYPSLVLHKSIATLVWLFLNFFTIFAVFYYYTRAYTQEIIPAIRLTYRIQIALGFLFVLIGLHERNQFLYYEPSFFSYALIPYVCTILYHFLHDKHKYNRTNLLDLTFIGLYFVSSLSAQFLLICLIAFLVYFFRDLHIKRILGAMGFIILTSIASTLYIHHVDDINTRVIKQALATDDLGEAAYQLLMRGGNRLPRMVSGYQEFKNHPLVGVGLSGYEAHSQTTNLCAHLEKGWPCNGEDLDPTGKPVVNIYVELLATSGLLGLMGFALFIYIIIRNRGTTPTLIQVITQTALITALLASLLDSNIYKLYFWMLLGLTAGAPFYLHKQTTTYDKN